MNTNALFAESQIMIRSLILYLVLMPRFARTSDTELDEFVEKDIKVFFASFPTFNLGLDDENGMLVSRSKYVNPSKWRFITRARLVRSGNGYVLIFGESNVCKDGNSAVRCNDERPWSVDRKPFGYTISTDGKCITKGPEALVELKPCVNTDDQVLDFKSADLGGCGSLESLVNGRKAGVTNVNILPPGAHIHTSVRGNRKLKKETRVESVEKVKPHERVSVLYEAHPVSSVEEVVMHPRVNVMERDAFVSRSDEGYGDVSSGVLVPPESGIHTEVAYHPVRRRMTSDSAVHKFSEGHSHYNKHRHYHEDHGGNETERTLTGTSSNNLII